MPNANFLFATVTFLMKVLFDREEVHLARRQEKTITKNTALGGSSDGFKHMGIIYTQLTGPARKLGAYSLLHESLKPEMDDILADQKIMAADKERIKMALVMVLRGATDFQAIRDALPNGVCELIPECRRLERTRPEAFTLADNPRSYTQYMALREKIDFYIAARLLY